jgi:hypothetical protein
MTIPYTGGYVDPGTGSGYTPSPNYRPPEQQNPYGSYWGQYIPPQSQRSMQQQPQMQAPPAGAPNWWKQLQQNIQRVEEMRRAAAINRRNFRYAEQEAAQRDAAAAAQQQQNRYAATYPNGYSLYAGYPASATNPRVAGPTPYTSNLQSIPSYIQAQQRAQMAWDAATRLWGKPPNQVQSSAPWVPTPDQYGYGYYDPGTGSIFGGNPRAEYNLSAILPWPGSGGLANYAGAPPGYFQDSGGGGYGGYSGGYGYPSSGGGYAAPAPGIDMWLYGLVNWRVGSGV